MNLHNLEQRRTGKIILMRKVFSIIIFVFTLSVISTAYAKGVSKEVKVVISVG